MKKDKHDTWFFTGAKAMSGTFDNAAAADSDSVNLPFTTNLTDTGHGLLAGSLLYIEGSTNYNGLREIKSLPDANSMVIYAKFVAETLAGTETWKTMFTYDQIVGSDLMPGSPFEFLGFEIHLNAASATAENLVVSIDSAKGSAWDTKIYSKDMNGIQDISNMFGEDEVIKCGPGDKINVTWTNTNTKTWGFKFFTRRLI